MFFCLSIKNLVVLAFIFGILIHLKLTFGYGMIQELRFTFSYGHAVIIGLFDEKLSFPHWISLVPYLKIKWPIEVHILFLEALLRPMDLLAVPYAEVSHCFNFCRFIVSLEIR